MARKGAVIIASTRTRSESGMLLNTTTTKITAQIPPKRIRRSMPQTSSMVAFFLGGMLLSLEDYPLEEVLKRELSEGIEPISAQAMLSRVKAIGSLPYASLMLY
jgi:hypothetical protein